jgi:hypothetical protein
LKDNVSDAYVYSNNIGVTLTNNTTLTGGATTVGRRLSGLDAGAAATIAGLLTPGTGYQEPAKTPSATPKKIGSAVTAPPIEAPALPAPAFVLDSFLPSGAAASAGSSSVSQTSPSSLASFATPLYSAPTPGLVASADVLSPFGNLISPNFDLAFG